MGGLVTSVESFRKRQGYDDLEDVNAAIESAIQSAGESVAEHLRTPFDRVLVVDTFFVQASFTFGSDEAVSTMSLALSRGFVDLDEDVVVRVATTRLGLDSDYVDIGPSGDVDYTVLNWEKGELLVQDYALKNMYVRVSYTAGFETEATDEAIALYQGVPLWLVQVVEMATVEALKSSAVYNKPEGGADLKSARAMYGRLIEPHIRYLPMAAQPMSSVVTAV